MDKNKIITTQNEISPCHCTLAISVPDDEVRSTISDFEKKFLLQAKIPGFRPGKIPPNLIKKRFSNKIREEVKNELIKVGLETGISRCDPEPVTFPTFVGEGNVELKEDCEFNFTVEFDVAPKIDLPEYKGIKLSSTKLIVKEDDINRVIEDLRKQRSTFEKVDRACKENDMLMVSYETVGFECEGAPESVRQLLQKDETWLVLTEPEIIPGVINGLKGRAARDNVSFDLTYPKNYQEDYLSGKSINYRFTIHEVHARIDPELNDEFAQLNGTQSVRELKSIIEKKIKGELEIERNAKLREQIFNFLLESTDFTLPPKILEAEKKYTGYTTAEEWIKAGRSVEQIEEEKEEFDRIVEERSTKRLRLRYIVSAIAKDEGIEVTDEEVEKYFEMVYNRLLKNLKQYPNKPKRDFLKSNIKWNYLMDRVGDRLIQIADIKEE